MIAIPNSEDPGRIREDAAIFDFHLDEEDLAKIVKLDAAKKGMLIPTCEPQ